MKKLSWIEDMKLRAGIGITGGQNIPSGNAYNRYGGDPSDSYYDLYGTNNSLQTGFALAARGNENTRWERNKSLNIGIDISLLRGKLNIIYDQYVRNVDGLLFNPELPGTAGVATAPYVNIAAMKNTGFDFSIRYQEKLGKKLGLDLSLNVGHYKNKIQNIDGTRTSFFTNNGGKNRHGVDNINQLGYPISSFYGFIQDGIFQNQAEVDQHADQLGKAIGRLRFRDINNDGVVNDQDKTIIGNPHPDFTAGLNIGLNYERFDFSLLIYASVGNQIYHYNRLYYDFGYGSPNMNREVITNSWLPDRPNARLPKSDVSDAYSNQTSTYYVEDGSFLRAKTIQIGYNCPFNWFGKQDLGKIRFYLQAENAFTFTKYSGLDPSLPNFGPGEDLSTGYDYGFHPGTKMYLFGINLEF